jgi:cell division protein FtsB
MSDKIKIKKYRRGFIFIFLVLIAVIVMFSITDTKRLFFIQEQRDTILVKDLTLEQLTEKIEKMSISLENKEKEVETLKQNLTILKKTLNEKNRNRISPIDSMSVIIGADGNVIQIRK